MSTSKHTPGNWYVAYDEPRKVISDSIDGLDPLTGENLVGGASSGPYAEANARLIAAAPDLLGIARQPKVTDIGGTLYIGFYDEHGGWSCPLPPEMRGFVERWAARRDAAIAKAEGRS
jgi:hypothetical protein